MKSFSDYLKEANGPTNSLGTVGSTSSGLTNTASAAGPLAGFDKKLFPPADDLLSQDFQTPAEPGEFMYNTFSSIYPVMKVSLKSNLGDGPSIDSMVAASKEFVNLMHKHTESVVRKNFRMFMGNLY